jgi:hypothetical protein
MWRHWQLKTHKYWQTREVQKLKFVKVLKLTWSAGLATNGIIKTSVCSKYKNLSLTQRICKNNKFKTLFSMQNFI